MNEAQAHDPPDEQAAVARLKSGDLDGLTTLVALHQARAQRAAYLITGDVASAEDVVSEAFLDAYDAIARFDASRPFGAWFHRIVVNRALGVLRARRRDAGSESLDWQVAPEPQPLQAAANKEARERIWRAVQALPDEERVAVVLFYYLDHDLAEISAVMDCPLGTVKWRLHSARKHLQPVLGPARDALLTQLDTQGGLPV